MAVSDNLHLKGGPSLKLDDPENVRRTVFARVSRLKLNDLLIQMDYPDANVHADKRSVTTTPLQKLFAMNSPFMLRQADSLIAAFGRGGEINEGIETLYHSGPPAAIQQAERPSHSRTKAQVSEARKG